MQICSFLPAATEILYALGLGESVAGVTFECDYPPEARKKPVVLDTVLAHSLTAAEVDRTVHEFSTHGESLYRVQTDLLRKIRPDLIVTQELCDVCAVDKSEVAKALHGDDALSMEERARAVVRAVVNAFHGRQRARKAVVQAVLAQGMAIETIGPVAAFIAEAGATPQHGVPALSHEQRFVLSRALMGTIRAAVLEEQPFFRSRAFEDELVRLVLSYVEAVSQASNRS